jgi:GNAT superfamily N-acetyltransferase
MSNDDAKADLDIFVAHNFTAVDIAAITEGLRAYDLKQIGFCDYCPLAVFIRDLSTGNVVGGLYGRSEYGLAYVDWFFLPEDLRRKGIGSRVLAIAEQEGSRRGCKQILLATLSVEAPGFYKKQGYDVAMTVECEPHGLTRYYMTKKL